MLTSMLVGSGTGVTAPRKYRRLTDAQWAKLEPLLVVKLTGAGAPRSDPRKIFDTLLLGLWEDRTSRELPKENYAPASTVARTLWEWAEDGRLEEAWRLYLLTLPKARVTQWHRIFDTYAGSWRDRESAPRYAGKVHNLYFKQMHQVLNSLRP